MSLSEAEVERLSGEVGAISSGKTLLAKPALEGLLELIRALRDIPAVDAAELLRTWVDKVQSPTIQKVVHPLQFHVNIC
jgi:hypothetical protein